MRLMQLSLNHKSVPDNYPIPSGFLSDVMEWQEDIQEANDFELQVLKGKNQVRIRESIET